MQINKPLSTETKTLLKEKAEAFEFMMQERIEENNALFNGMDAEAKNAPQQPLVDAQDLLSQIVQADDGKMPSERARHNMIDPDPIDVLNFCVAYMDECDAKIQRLTDVLKLRAACTSIDVHDQILEILNDKRNDSNG